MNVFFFVSELLSHLSFQYEISNGKCVYVIMLVTKISQEVEEETEVVNIPRSVVSGNVAARKGKQQTSSGKGGGTN